MSGNLSTPPKKRPKNAFTILRKGANVLLPRNSKETNQSALKNIDVACKTCYDSSNGNMIAIVTEFQIVDHYQRANNKYNDRIQLQDEWDTQIANQTNHYLTKINYNNNNIFPHNLANDQLFYRLNRQHKPILENIVYFIDNTNVNYMKYRNEKSKKRKRYKIQEMKDDGERKVTSPTPNAIKTNDTSLNSNNNNNNKNKDNSNEVDSNATNPQALENNKCNNNDISIQTNTIDTLFDKQSDKIDSYPEIEQKMQRLVDCNINIYKLVDNSSCALDNGSTDDIAKCLENLVFELQNKMDIQSELDTLSLNCLLNLGLRYYSNGIRIKRFRLTKNEFDKVVNLHFKYRDQFRKNIDNKLISMTPIIDGHYCVDFIYCKYCCKNINGPNIALDRGFDNGIAFVKQFEMIRQIWDVVCSCIWIHIKGSGKIVHESNKQQIETEKNRYYNRERHIVGNLWDIYFKIAKRGRSDTEFSEEIAFAHKNHGIDVGNRPHSEKAAPLFEQLLSTYVSACIRFVVKFECIIYSYVMCAWYTKRYL